MITFSGIDCSGKSTQIERLASYYDDNQHKYKVIWSRGGYTSWIEFIKKIVRKDNNLNEDEKVEYRAEIISNSKKAKLLLWASIWDLVRVYGIIFRYIEFRGYTIVCDRYIWDTKIDFKLKYGTLDFEKWICWKILLRVMKKPTHSIVLKIPAEESMMRSESKVEPFPETHDERVVRINEYLSEIDNNRWAYIIDGMTDRDDVTAQIFKILK